MRNVTVSLDDETARWARLEAARRDTSVSRLIGELLAEHMRAERAYEASMTRYLARETRSISDGSYPDRSELHDRAGLR